MALSLKIGREVVELAGKVECRHEQKYAQDGRLTSWYYWYMDGRGRFASGTASANVLHRVRDGEDVEVDGQLASILYRRLVAE